MYLMPTLVKTNNAYYFQFNDGRTTKLFLSVGKLDIQTGCYAIINEKNEQEYMDLFGNFTKQPTEFALHLYSYIVSEQRIPTVFKYYPITYFYTALVDFPSKYLINKEVLNFIVVEEQRRYKSLVKHKVFSNILDRLIYKKYANDILKQKKKRAQYLATKPEVIEEINYIFEDQATVS